MTRKKLTKIVATIGPSSEDELIIEKLIQHGVNVFRFNTKHGTVEWHADRINRVQRVANRLGVDVGILLDLQGPEIRLETLDKLPVYVTEGEKVKITPAFISGEKSICIPHRAIFETLKPGGAILIDDGAIELKIESVSEDQIVAVATEDGLIGHRKGVNFPGVHLDLPSLIHEDLKKLDMAMSNKVDFVALSFSRTKKDIQVLRKEMDARRLKAMIVAKIESMTALEHLDELIEHTDAVMVARGDLGVEVPIEQITYWQKTIIRKCRLAKKPVITATQMLQSMIESPRPTRAEATDVANAVIDGTDAVMLSGETANGKYPVKAVEMMSKIIKFNESAFGNLFLDFESNTDTETIVKALQNLLNNQSTQIKAVVVFTLSGLTARSISRIRPKVPIIAVTKNQKNVEELTLSYGVEAITAEHIDEEFRLPNPIIDSLVKKGILEKGSAIVVVHGQNYYEEGSTNALAIVKI